MSKDTPTEKSRATPPAPGHPAPPAQDPQHQHQAEPREVLGRHKNSGQKDHKGAR